MRPGARLKAAVEVLVDVIERHQQVTQALTDWGKAHRFAGSGDRAAIGNLVYDALRRRHTTKAGVWGRICVLEGSLRYRILEPVREEHLLSAERPGIVEPEVPHEVEPLGPVRFFVEFLRASAE